MFQGFGAGGRDRPERPLSKFEVVRAGQIVVEDGPCAPLAAGLFLHLLNKIPGTP